MPTMHLTGCSGGHLLDAAAAAAVNDVYKFNNVIVCRSNSNDFVNSLVRSIGREMDEVGQSVQPASIERSVPPSCTVRQRHGGPFLQQQLLQLHQRDAGFSWSVYRCRPLMGENLAGACRRTTTIGLRSPSVSAASDRLTKQRNNDDDDSNRVSGMGNGSVDQYELPKTRVTTRDWEGEQG